jgi:fibronectin-binding autotransporter adhesin
MRMNCSGYRRCYCLFLAVLSVCLLANESTNAADLAIYNFTTGSAVSTDAHAPTTAGNYDVRGIGTIDSTEGRVRAGGDVTGGPLFTDGDTIAEALAANTYHSFTLNTNATTIDFGSLAFNYTMIMPSGGFNVHVFSSATGFDASSRLAFFGNGGGASPAGNVNVDLTQYSVLQDFNGALEFRFYFVDGSASNTRVHTLDNIVVSEVGAFWNNSTGGSWSTAANWSTTPDVPGVGALSGRDVLLGTAIGANSTINLDTAVNLNRLSFGNAAASYSINPVTAATHTITLSGSAEVVASSGSHEIAARIGGTNGLRKTGTGTVTISGANTYTGNTDIQAGSLRLRSLASLPGAASVNTGASLVFMGDVLHSGAGANGVLASTLTGAGTISLNSSLTTETITINAAKTIDGIVDIGGGTLNVANAGGLGTGGTFASRTTVQGSNTTGKLALSANTAVSNELLRVDARTTEAPHLSSAGTNAWNGHVDGNGTGQFNIESTSGTLTLGGPINAGDTDALQRTFVFSGAGNTVISGSITDDAIVWDATNVGTRATSQNDNINVVKRGVGTLTINTATSNRDDYWRGQTTIEGGSMVITSGSGNAGELWSREIAVRSGATLTVSSFTNYNMQLIVDPDESPSTGDETGQILTGAGAINATNIGGFDDSIIRPGDNGAGTMTLNGKLTYQSFTPNATGSFGFGLSNVTTIGAGVNDLLQINGNLQLDATGGNIINVNISPVAGGLTNGTYTLMQYTGTRSGSATTSDFRTTIADTLGNAIGPSRQTLSVSLNDAAKRVELNVSGSAQTATWTGSGGNVWNVNGVSNWSTTDQKFFNLDNVVFNNTNAGNQFTIDMAANVAPNAVTFNNTSNTYTLTGMGGIVGSGPVNISGVGTVIFASDNNVYAGTTTIANGATLRIGNGTSTGNHFGTGALVNNGTFIMNKAANFGETIANVVSGSGTMRVDSGNLTLTANNTYSGPTVVNGGQLLVENLATNAPLGTMANGTTLNGGQLRANAQTATIAEPLSFGGGTFAVGGGTSARITLSGALSVATGGGTLQVDSGTDVVNGLGTRINTGLTVNSASTIASGGVLRVNTDASSTAVLNGGINGAGGVRKSGAGVAELTAATTFAGPTTVDGGTLKLLDSGNLASTQISVANAATLDTTGKGTPLSLSSGQSLRLNGLTGPDGGSLVTANSVLHNGPTPAKLKGNVTATSGSQLGGVGLVDGNVTAQTGSVLRVGRAGINTGFSGTTQTENFESIATGVAFANNTPTGLLPGWQFFDLGATNTDAAFAVQVPSEVVSATKMLAQTSVTTDFLQNPTPIAGAVAISPLATGGTVDKISADFTFDGGGDTDTNNLDSGLAFGFRDINNFFQIRLGRGTPTGNETRFDLSRIVNGQRILEVEAVGSTNFSAGFLDDTIYNAEILHDSSTGYVSYTIRDLSDVVLLSGYTVNEGFREEGAMGVLVTNDYAAWDNLSVTTGSTLPDAGLQSLTVDGNLTMTGGTLELDLAGTNVYDVLNVNGVLTAAGTLSVSLSEGFVPLLGNTFDVLDFSSVSGSFASLNLPALGPGLSWSTTNLLTTGVLEVVTSGGLLGDFDNDGDVDGRDFLVWQRNPGVGNLSDWQANYGTGSLTAITAVPEPNTILMLLSILSGMTTRRRSRSHNCQTLNKRSW